MKRRNPDCPDALEIYGRWFCSVTDNCRYRSHEGIIITMDRKYYFCNEDDEKEVEDETQTKKP